MNKTFITDIGFIIAYSIGYYIVSIFTGKEMTGADLCSILLIVVVFRLSKIYDLLKQRQCCRTE